MHVAEGRGSALIEDQPCTRGRPLWRVRVGTIGWLVAAIAFLLGLPILIQASIWILVIALLAAALLAVPLAWAGKWVSQTRFRTRWIKTALVLGALLTFLLGAPVYYFAGITQLNPALVPQATLTNGRRTIVFQGMQHVGAERFFKSVVYDLEDALSKGFVLYYEGVRPSTPQADAWLAATVTDGQDLSTAYRTLGELCGLRFQNDYFLLLGTDARAHPQSHVVADVSTLDLKREYDRLIATDRKRGLATAGHAARASVVVAGCQFHGMSSFQRAAGQPEASLASTSVM